MKIDLKKTDVYLVVLFYIVGITVTFSHNDYSNGLREPILDTVVYCFFSFSVAYIIVFKLFPYFFPKRQILRLFFWTVLLMAIVGVIEIWAYRFIEGDGTAFINKYWNKGIIWFYGISTSAENAGILVGMLLGKKFYDVQMDLQVKEKEKKENELRLLKSQIDPHFLFNNLNTVDALIDSDPKVAKAYLQKLSQLYRYLIRTKDDEVVLLEDELEFARNYIYLLEKRFGKAYQFRVEGSDAISDQFIPPGALQTLIENVVKHNISTAEEPIKTEIIIEKEQVIISNDLRLKPNVKTSNNTGLDNLKARFALLSERKIEISSDKRYTVLIPLINEID